MSKSRATPVRSERGPYATEIQLLPPAEPMDRMAYPRSIPAIAALGAMPSLALHSSVTYFVGENGSGKSTILEAIAVELGINAEGGSRNFNFATRASHSALSNSVRVSRTSARIRDAYFLRAESYFNVATNIEELDKEPGPQPPIISYYGGRSLHEQSHGQSFFALFQHRMGGPGLFLLDEPEAALSPQRQLQFLALLHQRVKCGSQFVIATHSPIVLAYPDSQIYALDEQGIHARAYKETEQFRVTRAFLESPGAALEELLKEEP